jgi:uncharacterized LabA/DUF88 family protein
MEGHDRTFEVSYDNLAMWAAKIVGGQEGKFVGAYYYTGYSSGGGGPRGAAFGRFLDGLSYRQGFFVRREPRVRRHKRGGRGSYWTEKRVDTRLVAEMIQLAAVDAYDCAVLFSGDQDLVPAVEAVQALGKQVWLGHWARRGVSKELRRRCFYEIDLSEGTAEISTGRTRGMPTAITTPTTEVTVVEVVAPSAAELEEAVLAAVRQAETHFVSTGGHLSKWYFVNRWRSEPPCPSVGAERLNLLDRLIEAKRVETYEYTDAKDRPTEALRVPEIEQADTDASRLGG